MNSVTASNKKSIMWAVYCKASMLYLANFTPCRAAIEVSPVPAIAVTFNTRSEAMRAAENVAPLFGSFDWHPVQVQA